MSQPLALLFKGLLTGGLPSLRFDNVPLPEWSSAPEERWRCAGLDRRYIDSRFSLADQGSQVPDLPAKCGCAGGKGGDRQATHSHCVGSGDQAGQGSYLHASQGQDVPSHPKESHHPAAHVVGNQ